MQKNPATNIPHTQQISVLKTQSDQRNQVEEGDIKLTLSAIWIQL